MKYSMQATVEPYILRASARSRLKPRQVVRKAAELTGWSEEDQQAVAQKLQLPGPDCPGSMCNPSECRARIHSAGL